MGLIEILKKEGVLQAAKYSFDNSILRLLIPYASEVVPGILGTNNYRTYMEMTKGYKAIDIKLTSGILSLGSEAARFVVTSLTYNETKSLWLTILSYLISTSFFSLKNQLRVPRFYKQGDLTDRLED